ncbi:MAG: hypothetical protein IJI66_11600 [Erysipelotrichaceae bacterium]|nr:hypothetical protein [Erysipelotrichaceae bacterium]
MDRYIRNKLIFKGTAEEMKPFVQELKYGDEPLNFNKFIPVTDETEKEEKWGIARDFEEFDWVLWRNDTILEYTFDTINAIPLPVYRKLAELYPEKQMEVKYADEDLGENCGIYESVAGSNELIAKEPDDPFEFSCEVWDKDPEEEMQERMINFYEE